jgi:hypothetical protein
MKLGFQHIAPSPAATAASPSPAPAAAPSPARSPNPAWMNWLTMFLLIGNTANPFFYESIEMLAISFVILLGCWFLKQEEDTRLNSYFWVYLIVLTILQASQSLIYHAFPVNTSASPLPSSPSASWAVISSISSCDLSMFSRLSVFFSTFPACSSDPSRLS